MGTLENKTFYFFEGWLTLHPDEAMKLTSKRPRSVTGGGRCMALSIRVPKSLFATPELSATVTISQEQAREFKIDTVAAARALEASVGAMIDVTVRYPETPAQEEGGEANG